ncbi:MAG TPA: glycosyltransferase family 2 protein [Opitutaceae bacterium]
MSRCEVSVVLPAFNAAGSIGRAIEGVRAQSMQRWELIFVDDGSSDDTFRAALEAAGGDQRVRLERIEHGGIARALNAGIALARGRLIARMDADDDLYPERLEAQVGFFLTHPAIGVAGSLVEFGGDAAVARGYVEGRDFIMAA